MADVIGSFRKLAEDGTLVGWLADERAREEIVAFACNDLGCPRPVALALVWAAEQILAHLVVSGASWLASTSAQALEATLRRVPGGEKAIAKISARMRDERELEAFRERLRLVMEGSEPATRLEVAATAPDDVQLATRILVDLEGLTTYFPGEFDDLHGRLAELHELLSPPLPLVTFHDTGNRLHFRKRHVPLLGREQEMATLRRFRELPEAFRWAVVTGPGGVGKSRLALEVCLEIAGPWRAGFLDRNEQFAHWESWRPARPTLIVIDYVAERAERIRYILSTLLGRSDDPGRATEAPLRHPVRVLLLERRKGEDEDWWRKLLDVTAKDRLLATGLDNSVLNLATIGDGALYESMRTLVRQRPGATALPPIAETIAALAVIDRQKRPLFAAMAADAYAERGVFNFSRDELLTEVVAGTLRKIWPDAATPSEATLREQNLWALATMVRGVYVGDVQRLPTSRLRGLFPPDGIAGDVHLSPGFGREALTQVGAQALASAATRIPEGSFVTPIEPDIVGSWFVLNHRMPAPSQPVALRDALVDAAWSLTDADALSFFAWIDRLRGDFLLELASASWRAVFRPPPQSGASLAPSAWGMLTVNLTYDLAPDPATRRLAEEAFEQLWQFADRTNEPEVRHYATKAAINLVRGLAPNMATRDRAEAVAGALWQLAEDTNKPSLWLDAARAAFNLINGLAPDAATRKRAEAMFEQLWRVVEGRNEPELRLHGAKAAVNLIYDLAPDPASRGRADAIFVNLWQLAESTKEPEIWLEAGKAAVNLLLGLAPDPAARERVNEVFEQVWQLHERTNEPEARLCAVQAAVNLINDLASDPASRERADNILTQLWQLAGRTNEPEVWGGAARAAFNLISGLSPDPVSRGRAEEVFMQLWQLAGRTNEPEVRLFAAQAAVNLISGLAPDPASRGRAEEVFTQLWQFAEHTNEHELWQAVACGAVVMLRAPLGKGREVTMAEMLPRFCILLARQETMMILTELLGAAAVRQLRAKCERQPEADQSGL